MRFDNAADLFRAVRHHARFMIMCTPWGPELMLCTAYAIAVVPDAAVGVYTCKAVDMYSTWSKRKNAYDKRNAYIFV